MTTREQVLTEMDKRLSMLRADINNDLADETAFEALEEMEAHLRELRRRNGAVTVHTVYDGDGNMIDQRIEPIEQKVADSQRSVYVEAPELNMDGLSDLTEKLKGAGSCGA